MYLNANTSLKLLLSILFLFSFNTSFSQTNSDSTQPTNKLNTSDSKKSNNNKIHSMSDSSKQNNIQVSEVISKLFNDGKQVILGSTDKESTQIRMELITTNNQATLIELSQRNETLGNLKKWKSVGKFVIQQKSEISEDMKNAHPSQERAIGQENIVILTSNAINSADDKTLAKTRSFIKLAIDLNDSRLVSGVLVNEFPGNGFSMLNYTKEFANFSTQESKRKKSLQTTDLIALDFLNDKPSEYISEDSIQRNKWKIEVKSINLALNMATVELSSKEKSQSNWASVGLFSVDLNVAQLRNRKNIEYVMRSKPIFTSAAAKASFNWTTQLEIIFDQYKNLNSITLISNLNNKSKVHSNNVPFTVSSFSPNLIANKKITLTCDSVLLQ